MGPVHDWSAVGTPPTEMHDDVVSTLFAVSNGCIGIRDQSGELAPDLRSGTLTG